MEISSESNSTFRRKIKKATFWYSLCSYSTWFLVALVISLTLIAFSLYVLVDAYQHGDASIACWCQSIITFLLGAWITDRPRFIKNK